MHILSENVNTENNSIYNSYERATKSSSSKSYNRFLCEKSSKTCDTHRYYLKIGSRFKTDLDSTSETATEHSTNLVIQKPKDKSQINE